MRRNIIRLTENRLRNIVRESVRRVINEEEERKITASEYSDRKTFIRNLNDGCFDEKLYKDKEGVINMARRRVCPELMDKVLVAIDNKYNSLHNQYPDGMPVLTQEQIEQRKRARKQIKNINHGTWDYQLFMDGEKFVKKMLRKYPDFPQVAEEAEKRRKWVERTYSFDDMPRDYMYGY